VRRPGCISLYLSIYVYLSIYLSIYLLDLVYNSPVYDIANECDAQDERERDVAERRSLALYIYIYLHLYLSTYIPVCVLLSTYNAPVYNVVDECDAQDERERDVAERRSLSLYIYIYIHLYLSTYIPVCVLLSTYNAPVYNVVDEGDAQDASLYVSISLLSLHL